MTLRFRLVRTMTVAALVICNSFIAAVRAETVSEVHYLMGTYMTVSVDGMAAIEARETMRTCFTEVGRLDSVFSRFIPDSELNRVNSAAGSGSLSLSGDMADLLRWSIELRVATDGAFDATLGALTAFRPDAAAGLAQAIHGPSRAATLTWHDDSTIDLPSGIRLDFDGIAKGYAVDRCVDILRAHHVTRALVNFGESSQYALGSPIGARGWPIAVRGLRSDRIEGTILLQDRALSASRVLGNSRDAHGARIRHIVDPATGTRLAVDALALVVTDRATDAEAYSKALLIWGADGTDRRWRRLRRAGVAAAILIGRSGRKSWNPGSIEFEGQPQSMPLKPGEDPLL